MSFFQEVEGEAAVLVSNGVYSQVPIYARDGFLYAKTGGGFVRLMADGSTTKAKTRLDFMSFEKPLFRDTYGRLCTADVKGAKQIERDRARLLLGSPDA